MFYKLLLLDIDGTLARDRFLVSENVKKSILSIKKDLVISLISQRSFNSVQWYIQELGLDSYHIVEGGARLIDSSGQSIWVRYLGNDTVQSILRLIIDRGLDHSLCIDGKSQSLDIHPVIKHTPKITRISILNLDKKAARIITEYLKKLNGIDFYYSSRYNSSKVNIDITHKFANKKNGMLRILNILNLSKEHTVGVGDGYTDIPFLKEVGFKVAMGNAVNELKKISDYIAPDVDSDGLVNVIELIKNYGN